MSSAPACGGRLESDTVPDSREQRGVHCSTNKKLRQMKRADPQRVEKSNHCWNERTYSWQEEHYQGLGQDEVQDKDQDEAQFKISVGMGVMNCADNTVQERCHHDRKEQDHSDEAWRNVYVLREEGQACAQEE